MTVIRSPIRPVIFSPIRQPTTLYKGGGFTTESLFGSADSGFYYDVSDASRLWETTAALANVDGDTDPIGLVLSRQGGDGRGVVNRLAHSQEIDNAVWTKVRSTVTANATIAPDGTTTADKIIEDSTASNTHQNFQTFTAHSGVTYTLSAYFKADTRTQVALNLSSGVGAFSGAVQTVFNLSNGTVVSGTGTIVLVGDWYRCSVSNTCVSTAAADAIVRLANAGSVTYTGDGASGLFLWGLQLEQGSSATAYQPNASTLGGPGNHATSSGSARPFWYTAGYGRGDASDDSLLTTFTPAAAGNTIMARVTVPASLAGTQVAIGTSGSSTARFFAGFNTSGHLVGGVGSDSTGTVLHAVDYRGTTGTLALREEGANWFLYWNGVQIATGALNGSPTTAIPYRLFSLNNNGTASSFFGGDIYDALAINRALSPAEILRTHNLWSKGGGATFDPIAMFQAKGAAFFYHDFVGRTDLTWQDTSSLTEADGSGEAVAQALGIDQIGDRTLAATMAAQLELATNGGFDSDTAWTKGTNWAITGGQAVYSGASTDLLSQNVGLVQDRHYRIPASSPNSVNARLGDTGASPYWISGTQTIIARCTGSSGVLSFRPPVGPTTVDNVSVKEVPGYHATQSVSTSFRPTRQADGSLKGDRLDDNLLQRLTSSTSMFMAAAILGASTPAATAAIIGGPVSTTRGYLARDAAGKLCAGVGADGPSTIVGGSDIAGLKGVVMLNIDASGNVDLEWMPKGGALTSLYSAAINGAVAAGTALRLFATNPSGSPANFGGDSLYLAAAIQTTLTPAERLALATDWNARIPS